MARRTRSGAANMLAASSHVLTRVAIPIANIRANWNEWPDLRYTRTKSEAKRVINIGTFVTFPFSQHFFYLCNDDRSVKRNLYLLTNTTITLGIYCDIFILVVLE